MTASSGSEAQLSAGPLQTKSCPDCGKLFARTEHLQRHQRIHTRETPFPCPYCGRRFQRLDVRSRHMAKSCTLKPSSPLSGLNETRSARVRVACDTCRVRKLKCTGRRPCSPCRKGSKDCHYTHQGVVASKPPEKHMPVNTVARRLDDWDASNTSANSNAQSSSGVVPRAPRRDSHAFDALSSTFPGNITSTSNASGLEQSIESLPSKTYTGLGNPSNMLNVARLSSQDIPLDQSSSATVSSQPLSLNAPIPTFEHAVDLPLSHNAITHFPSTTGVEPGAVDPNAWDFDFGSSGVSLSGNIFDLFPSAENPCLFSELEFNEHTALNFDTYNNFLSNENIANFQLPNQPFQGQSGSEIFGAAFPSINIDASRWLRTNPAVSKFDRVIMNHFMNIFLNEVRNTLTSFLGFEVHETTGEEEVLAMAAVGGLYCTTNGSQIIARAMCSDSRRLLLTRLGLEFPENIDQKISIVRTFILLELFGMCSGDKRLCELSEAFHMQLLQTVSQCNFLAIPETHYCYHIVSRIINDLRILECYRSTLFQWTPNFGLTIFSTLSAPSEMLSSPSPPETFDIFQATKALLTPSGPPVIFGPPCESFYTLAALLVLASHAMSTWPMAQSGLWEKRFFELGLNSWLHSHHFPPQESALMLFHQAFIALHTNMATIHAAVREFSICNTPLPAVFDTITQWRESEACDLALFHAARSLDLGARIQSMPRPAYSAQSISNISNKSRTIYGEAPHTAICVYIAAITIWATEISKRPANYESARAVISRGCGILQRLKLRVAVDFVNILNHLEAAS